MSLLEDYKHTQERAKLGVPPLPLTANSNRACGAVKRDSCKRARLCDGAIYPKSPCWC